MACLSPSPSGRRLSELLEEKQEPFLLDIHLLEKGCSSRLLDGYDSALCWPAPGNDAAAAVLKRLTSKKTKPATCSRGRKSKKNQQQQTGGGLLKLLLSKILHGKASAGSRKPAALQFSDSFKIASAAVAPAPPRDLDAVKTADVKAEPAYSDDELCSYSDDDDEKQHSPVSVLEPHPFESLSPVHSSSGGKRSPSRNAVSIFREILDAGYSPALLAQLLAKSDDLLAKDDTAGAAAGDDEDDDYFFGCYRTSPKKNSRHDDAAYWEANRAELARVSALVAAEVPSARLDDAALERDDVGAGVADAVLDALLRELVVDLGGC